MAVNNILDQKTFFQSWLCTKNVLCVQSRHTCIKKLLRRLSSIVQIAFEWENICQLVWSDLSHWSDDFGFYEFIWLILDVNWLSTISTTMLLCIIQNNEVTSIFNFLWTIWKLYWYIPNEMLYLLRQNEQLFLCVTEHLFDVVNSNCMLRLLLSKH